MATDTTNNYSDFRPVKAAFAIVGLARAYPGALLKIAASTGLCLVIAMIGFVLPDVVPETTRPVVSLFAIPMALVGMLLFMIAMPVAIFRLALTGEVSGRTGLKLGSDEFTVAISAFCIHTLATLGAFPTFIFALPAVMVVNTGHTSLWVLPIVFIAVTLGFSGYIYVFARLGPSLALSVYRKWLLVTRTWRPTRPIRWKVLLAWLPWWLSYMALSLIPLFLSPSGSQTSFDPFLFVLSGLYMLVLVMFFAMAAATHAYIARYLLDRDPELGVVTVT